MDSKNLYPTTVGIYIYITTLGIYIYRYFQSISIPTLLLAYRARPFLQVEILDQRLAVLNDLYSFLQTQLEVKHSNKLEALHGSSGVKQLMGSRVDRENVCMCVHIYIYIDMIYT